MASAAARAGRTYSTDHVYTFAIYDHAMNYAEFRLPFFGLDMVKVSLQWFLLLCWPGSYSTRQWFLNVGQAVQPGSSVMSMHVIYGARWARAQLVRHSLCM